MPTHRVPMRKIREVLRLQEAGFSARSIARVLGLGRTAVAQMLDRAHESALPSRSQETSRMRTWNGPRIHHRPELMSSVRCPTGPKSPRRSASLASRSGYSGRNTMLRTQRHTVAAGSAKRHTLDHRCLAAPCGPVARSDRR